MTFPLLNLKPDSKLSNMAALEGLYSADVHNLEQQFMQCYGYSEGSDTPECKS